VQERRKKFVRSSEVEVLHEIEGSSLTWTRLNVLAKCYVKSLPFSSVVTGKSFINGAAR
jgi:hypothetical protein